MKLKLSDQARKSMSREAARAQRRAEKEAAAAAKKAERDKKDAAQQAHRERLKAERQRCVSADEALTELVVEVDGRFRASTSGRKTLQDLVQQQQQRRKGLLEQATTLGQKLVETEEALTRAEKALAKAQADLAVGPDQCEEALRRLQAVWEEAEDAWSCRSAGECKRSRDRKIKKAAKRLLGLQ